MIIINNYKKTKKYQQPQMPEFEYLRTKLVWLKRQKMLSSIYNVKSVSIQVKDIKQMIFSKNLRLVSLYTKFHLNNMINSYSDDDYITISKSSDLNKLRIYALISADWLLNASDLENKSIEELQQECVDLQNEISLLKEKKKTKNYYEIGYRIKLLEYKLSCLSEFILGKVNLPDLDKANIERVLLKK